jgi:hypothetical protein
MVGSKDLNGSVAVEKACRPARCYPTQAKERLEWGTHHLLPVENLLPVEKLLPVENLLPVEKGWSLGKAG